MIMSFLFFFFFFSPARQPIFFILFFLSFLFLSHSLMLSLCPACFSWLVVFWVGVSTCSSFFSQRLRVSGQCFEKVRLSGSVSSVPTVTRFHSEGRESIQLWFSPTPTTQSVGILNEWANSCRSCGQGFYNPIFWTHHQNAQQSFETLGLARTVGFLWIL